MELVYILAVLSRSWLVLAGVAGTAVYGIVRGPLWLALGGFGLMVVMLLLRNE